MAFLPRGLLLKSILVFSIFHSLRSIILQHRASAGTSDPFSSSRAEALLKAYSTGSIFSSHHHSIENATIVAHMVSFARCGPGLMEAYLDAMLALRHSIHQNSVHNEGKQSRYSYKMFAIIYQEDENDFSCAKYQDRIRLLGYEPLLRRTPVNISAIKNAWFRNTIDRTGVVGSRELIKLYLYTMTDFPIVVHWDLDMVQLQPMDDLYDAMLHNKASERGRSARNRIEIQHPTQQVLPDRIDAFFTRDIATWHPKSTVQVMQGGFLVARPSAEDFENFRSVIFEANYSRACGPTAGWGQAGYGCKQGSMHYQGIIAYFYDKISPGRHVELDACRWNQVAHDVVWRGPKHPELIGNCKAYPPDGNLALNRFELGACDDCRVTPIAETKVAHYTACGKPWQCHFFDQTATLVHKGKINMTTCGLLQKEFFKVRKDLEAFLHEDLGDISPRLGNFHTEYFLGYCEEGEKYIGMNLSRFENVDMNLLYSANSQ